MIELQRRRDVDEGVGGLLLVFTFFERVFLVI